MLEMYKKVVLNNYANFKGRARRKEYWMFILVNWIIAGILTILTEYVFSGFKIVYLIFNLAVLVPSIAVAFRRIYDVNKEWWYLLIPFYNIYLLCQDGTVGPNQYGADPKNRLEDIREIGKDLN